MMADFSWSERRVLVTGAGGFLGSHLVERFVSLGADVRAMVHGNMRGNIGYLACLKPQTRSKVQILGGNIRDGAFVREAAVDIDTVLHLAAITSVVYSYSNPEETVLTNVFGTLNVCNACRHEGVRRLVHVSSAGVYGETQGDAITENHPVRPFNPYTASKLAADNVVESFHLSYELPVAIARIFNAYGPRLGKFLVIPNIVLQLMRGSKLRLGDLSPTRNFTYVDDIVSAFVRMAEADGMVGEVVNFGSEEAVTMGQLAQMIGEIMGKELDIEVDPERLRPSRSEIYRVVAECGKARDRLGWQPTVPLREGLERTIAWIVAGGYMDTAAGPEEYMH
jgi:nucleoside-diphosphate-sugar epimerase